MIRCSRLLARRSKLNWQANWPSVASCPRLPLRAPFAVLCCTATSRGARNSKYTHTNNIALGHSYSFIKSATTHIHTYIVNSHHYTQAKRVERDGGLMRCAPRHSVLLCLTKSLLTMLLWDIPCGTWIFSMDPLSRTPNAILKLWTLLVDINPREALR